MHGLSLERHIKNWVLVLSEMVLESCQWGVEGNLFSYMYFLEVLNIKAITIKNVEWLNALPSFTKLFGIFL